MKRPIHGSWLVMTACSGLAGGVIVVGRLQAGAFSQFLWLTGGVFLVMLALWRRKHWCISVALIGGAMIGLWRGGISTHELTMYRSVIGQTQVVSGVVSEDPGTDKTGHATYSLRHITINGQEFPGKIWVVAANDTPAHRSDRIAVEGKITDGFANFSATMYRATVQHIERQAHADPALEIRDTFAGFVQRAIHEPAASLGLGVLVGEKRALPTDIAEAFRVASLTHIVVASGYNLTILVRLARRLFARMSKFSAAMISGGLVISFMAVTGLSPSMSRAGLVAFLSLAAWYYGRKFHPIVLLALAAAATLLVEPSYGWNDLGWSLSFASFAGVMLVAPVMQAYFFGDKKPGTLRQIIGETLSAQVMTLPLIVLSFDYISIIGVGANAVIVPFVPLAMLLTFCAGIGGWLLPSIAGWIGWPAGALLNGMIAVSHWFAQLSWAKFDVDWSPLLAGVFYAALAVMWVWCWRKTRIRLQEQNLVE